MGLKLVAVNGSQAVAMPAGRTLEVGRSPGCDMPIRDLTVSRHHGEIEATPAGLRIRDLGSTNGTFINGARIGEGLAAPGARVTFGKVAFQVVEERGDDETVGGAAARPDGEGLVILGQARAQSYTDIATLLAPDSGSQATAAGGLRLRGRGAGPVERRAASLALLLEVSKELSQQGEPARLLEKTARLIMQVMAVDRVDVLMRGDDDEMVPRVSKVRAGAASAGGQIARAAVQKAVEERVALLLVESTPEMGTDAISPAGSPATQAAPGAAAGGAAGAAGTAAGDPGAAGAPLATAGAAAGLAVAAPPADDRASTDRVAEARERHAEGAADAAGAPPNRQAPLDAAGAAGGTGANGLLGDVICAPLLGMQATVLGMLCASTPAARTLGREDLDFLTGLAGIVAVTLENLVLAERARGEAVAQAGHQRHFAPFVAEQIAGHDGAVDLGASRRRAVILDCEIRDFAALTAALPPAEVAHLLDEFFSEMIDVVFEHGGTLDKTTGAGLVALWGVPLSHHDDADLAVQAAVEMQRGVERLNVEWSRQGRPHLAMAAGMDLGEVFAGQVGSDRRRDFTAIGQPVERAAQLRAAATAGDILASEALLEALSSPPPVEAMPASPACRIDWRTPPTLRQSDNVAGA